MSVNRSGFLLVVLAILVLAFIGSRRLFSGDAIRVTGETPEPAPVAETASPRAAISRPTVVAAPPVASSSGPSVSSTPIPEPVLVVAPEILDLKKKVAAYALQEFSKSIGIALKPLFVVERFEFNSVGPGLEKFRGSTDSGDQSMTVLVQKARNVDALIAAYLGDIGIDRTQVVTEPYGSALFATVVDPEGAHMFVAAERGGQTYLIAETRERSSFTAAEVAAFKSQF